MPFPEGPFQDGPFPATYRPDSPIPREPRQMEGTTMFVDAEVIKKFVESGDAFSRLSREWFELADKNGDGVLCELEMRKWLESIDILESDQGVPLHKTEEELRVTYRDAFELFDADHNGAVDLQKFRAQLRSMLLAIADGLARGRYPPRCSAKAR